MRRQTSPAITGPRILRGISDPSIRYHKGSENLDAYRTRGIGRKFPQPEPEELVAFLKDTIESYAGGRYQAAWEIHCAVHLIEMIERSGTFATASPSFLIGKEVAP